MVNPLGSKCPRLTYLRLRIPRSAGRSARAPAVVRVTVLSHWAPESRDLVGRKTHGPCKTAVSVFLPQKAKVETAAAQDTLLGKEPSLLYQ